MTDVALIGATVIMGYFLIVAAGWYVRHRQDW